MNKLFATILAAGAALALSAAHAAANPVSLGIQVTGTPEGPEVTAVLPGHAGEAVGFKAGDILLEAGGEPISPEVFMAYVKEKKAGDQLSFKIQRGDAVLELSGKATHVAPNPTSLGIQLMVSPEGAEVMSVFPGHVGEAVGFEVGDILLEAGGEPISPEVLTGYMKEKKPGDPLSFKVQRADAVIELTGKAVAAPEAAPAESRG